jgi:hypothetical protein
VSLGASPSAADFVAPSFRHHTARLGRYAGIVARRQIARLLLLAAAALLFGALASVIKGSAGGLRDGAGNLSAPWLVLPLLAAAGGSRGRVALGAALGLLTTLTALAGFYLANAFVLDLGPHSTLHDIGLTLNAGNLWLRLGLISGPVMGAAGAWAIRRDWSFVAGIVPALLVLEPIATYLFVRASRGPWAGGDGAWNGVYAAEALLGATFAVALWVRQRRHRSA